MRRWKLLCRARGREGQRISAQPELLIQHRAQQYTPHPNAQTLWPRRGFWPG
ncbi:hypothetical protein GGH92_009948 [Coemansia sp. RSA 2673]|nr:hypothetical protein GGH92_009948 [Coemansia sp. RSA 2673]